MNVDVRNKIPFKMISCQGDSLSDDGRFYGRRIGRAVHGIGRSILVHNLDLLMDSPGMIILLKN